MIEYAKLELLMWSYFFFFLEEAQLTTAEINKTANY